jgi:PKD repeat protein
MSPVDLIAKPLKTALKRLRAPSTILLISMVIVLGALAMPMGMDQDPLDILSGDGDRGGHGDVGPASPGPDLNATSDDLSVSDTTPNVGQTITITLKVRNTGDTDGTNVTVDVYDGDDITGTVIDSLFIATSSSSSTTTLTTTWRAVLGSHMISMYLDTADNVTEDSETNNDANITVDVLPDLSVSSSSIILSKDPIREFDTVTLSVRVMNAGGVDASSARVIVYNDVEGDGDAEILNKSVNVPAGTTATAQSFVVFTSGDHTLYATVDPLGAIDESDETNNEANRSITVLGVPDVRLDTDAFLLSSNQVGSVIITIDAFNDGNATASGYRVAVYDGNPLSGGVLIGRVNLADIAVDGRTTAQQAWTATAGEHHLYAELEREDPQDPAGNNKADRKVYILADVVSVAGPDMVADSGEDLTFDGSNSYARGGSITNYTWDYGDSTMGYGASTTHNFTNGGSTVKIYTVTLTVKDGSGTTGSDTLRVFVNPAGGTPPTADAGAPPSGRTLEDLSFDGTASSGNITQYYWDFGDGSTGGGNITTHSYWDDGSYDVSLVVVNNLSIAHRDTISVSVQNRPPVVQDIEDIETDIGITHDFMALLNDADGYIASILWDFGDGTTSTARGTSHTWTSDGPHTASLNVTDDDGASTIINFWVNVTNVLPEASFTAPETRPEGQYVQVDARGSTEPGNDIVKYEWDWDGDGTWDNTTGPVSFFIYNDPGTYSIILRITDGEATTNTTVMEVVITNVEPNAIAYINQPRTNIEGANFTFNSSRSTEPGRDFAYFLWDLDGDGTFEVNTTEEEFSRSFTKVGRFEPVLQVWDDDGTFGEYTRFWVAYTVTNTPPLINESSSSGLEGTNITVTVDADEPGKDLVDFYWDFDNDGTVDAHTDVPYANHTWYEAGSFTVWVNVTDIDHTETSPSWGAGEVTVDVTNVAPRPRVEGAQQATEGTPRPIKVDLLGTEHNISLYSFDLDNDGIYDLDSTTAETNLTFTKTGDLQCRVRTIDTDGSEGVALFNVFVFDVAPTVTAKELIIGAEGEAIHLEVEAFEPGMDIDTYAFDWDGDGTADDSSDEPWFDHVYNSPGIKRIQVFVIDEDMSSGSVTLRALIANTPPTADVATPPQTSEGETITLSAANSTEPGDDIVQYEWDFDGDGLFDTTTGDETIDYAWQSPGRYTIRLRVTDIDGSFDIDAVPVEVLNVEPMAMVVVTLKPEDMPSILDGSDSYDPGGIHLYEWNITSFKESFSFASTEPSLEYTFDRKVDYTITLIVHDDPTEGTSDSTTVTVDKDDVITIPPEVTWSVPLIAREGEPVIFQAWAEDPFPEGIGGQIMDFSWQFGDGSTGNGPVVTHVYQRARALPYTVTLTVTDGDTDQAAPLSMNITVTNVPPVILPVEPIIVKRGGTKETQVSAEDATSLPGELDYLLGANAPDWATLDGNSLVVNPGQKVQPGTYLVPVRVVDVLGAESQVEVPVLVTAEEAVAGVTWGSFLMVLLPLLLLFLILAVMIAMRMRPPVEVPPPPRDAPSSDYDSLFEKPGKKAKPVAKVESERIDLDMADGDEPATTVAPEPAYHMAKPEPEPEETPPLPSWMSPTEAKPTDEVQYEEREMKAPPEAPPEWQAPKEATPESSYKFRHPHPEKPVRYRGSGPPRP